MKIETEDERGLQVRSTATIRCPVCKSPVAGLRQGQMIVADKNRRGNVVDLTCPNGHQVHVRVEE